MKKRIVSLILLCGMMFQLCCTPAIAVGVRPLSGGEVQSGQTETDSTAEEESFSWSLSGNGWLYLDGTGDMPDYPNGFPWADRKDEIVRVVVGEGITSVSDLAFYGCSALASVSLPHGLKKLGAKAFGATAITKLVIPSTVEELSDDVLSFCPNEIDVYFYGDKPTGDIGLEKGTIHYSSIASGWEDSNAEPFYGYAGHRYVLKPGSYRYDNSYEAISDGYVLAISSCGEQAFIESILTRPVWLGAYYSLDYMMWNWEGPEEWSEFCYSKQPPWGSDSSRLYIDTDGEWWETTGYDTQLAFMEEIADYEAPDPLTWYFDEDTYTLTIYGEGEMPEYTLDDSDYHPVTGAPWAEHRTEIKSLVIEGDITSISTAAFAGCWNLETVTLPSGLTSIGNFAFEGASVKNVYQSVMMGSTQVIPGFPYALKSIGDQAFYGNSGMTELNLYDTSVETIGEMAFGWNGTLTTLTLPDTLVTLENLAFVGCAFASVVLPESLETMGSGAFGSNANLTDLYFCGSRPFESITTDGEGGTTIHCKEMDDSWSSFTQNSQTGVSAVEFPSYQGHQILYVPGSYTVGQANLIARNLMGGFLTAITNEEENGALAALLPVDGGPAWIGATYGGDQWRWSTGETFSYSNWGENVTAADGYSAVMTADGTWSSRTGDTRCSFLVEFPTPVSTTIVTVEIDGITVTFDKSIGLVISCSGAAENFVMPGSIAGVPVNEIARNAFVGCSFSGMLDLSLTSLTGINGICMSQTELEAVSLPATVTFVMDTTFYNCPALERVIFNGNAPTLSTENMDGHQVTHEYFAPNAVFYYVDGKEGWTVAHWNGVPALPLSDEGYLKADGGDVTLLVDPQGTVVSYIGSGAEIVIPESVGNVTVTGLGDRLFYGDTAVTELQVPATVTSIGEFAFFGTENLLTAVFEGDAPTNVADTAFANASPKLVIDCPEDGKGWTNPWHGVNTTLPAEDIVYYDVPGGQLIFDRVSGTITGYTGSPTVVVVPEKIAGTAVRAIADGAMKGASDLSSMDLSATVITATGADIWDNCTDLVRLVLPETVTSIDISALTGCSSITQFIFLGDEPTIENFGGNDWPSATDYTLWFSEGAALGDLLDGMTFVKRFLTLNVDGGALLLERSSGLVVGYLGQPVDVSIPARVNFDTDVDIRGIGKFAFESCLSLESISVPSGMTVLERSAFHNCEYLQAVDLSQTAITKLEEKVFHNCLRVEYIYLPEGITSIGTFCFNDCNALKSISIPSTVTTIYDGAFYKCDTLEELVFPAALTSLAVYAIPYCANLKTVDLSLTSITRLDIQTFTACPALEEVYLPGTLTEVSANAFSACAGVKSLYFMGDAPTATGDMSGYLPNATAYYQPAASGWGATWYGLPTAQDPTWVLYDVVGGQLIFNTRTGEITGYTGGPEGVVVPAEIGGVAVSGIAPNAFAGCETLRVMDLSETAITSVRPTVWDGCYELIRLVLPDTLETFNLSALDGCDALEHVIFRGELPAVIGDFPAGSYLFWHRADVEPEWEVLGRMAEFTPLTVPGGTLVYDSENSLIAAHYGKPTEVSGLEVPVTGIGANAFAYAYKLQTVTLPAAVESIGVGAFRACTGLQTADLSATAVIDLNDQLFQNCVSMTNVYLPETLQTINQGVFWGCASLGSLLLPDELIFIGARAFGNCSALSYLDFPASLSQIIGSAFVGCSNLERLTFAGNAPSIMPQNVPAGQLSNYIPDAVVYYMEFTSGWSNPFSGLEAVSYPNPFVSRFTVPGGSLLFDKRSGLIVGYEGAPTSIRLPSDIENVMVNGFAAGALKGCSSLVWADLSDISMSVLPGSLFGNCTSLTDVILPPQISTMVGTAFGGCAALERVMFTGPAPGDPDNIAQDLAAVAGNAVVYFPEEYSDSWTTPLWYSNTAYPYASREGDVSWPFPGGTLFFNEDSGALVGCSLYRRHILIPETVLGQEVASITADAFSGHSFVRMFFLGKAPGKMDLTGCPADMAIYYPVADAALWEDSVQGFAARPYSPAEDMVSHTVTGGTILLDPANGMISGFTGDPTRVLVPASISGCAVTGIRGDAFVGAEKLELVILPDSVTYVESDAFMDCDADIYGPEELGFTPLKVTATEPVNSSTVGGDRFYLKVTTNIPYALPLTVENGTISNSINGVYTFRVDLSALKEGEYTHTFTVSCADYGLSHEITLLVDRKAPSAPGNFRAEAGVLSNTLYWKASIEANVNAYIVYLKVGDGWTVLATVDKASALTYTHSGLTAGEEYTYAMTAMDIYGQESQLSSASSATPKPDEVPPVITGVSPQNGSTLTGAVTFTIQAEDNIGLASVMLEISSDEGAEKSWTSVGETTFTDTAEGTAVFSVDTTACDDTKPLYVRLSAVDIYGNKGYGSTIFTYAVDNTPPEQVTGLRGESTTTVITLNWSDVAAQDFKEFRVEQKQEDGSWKQVRVTSTTRGVYISGLTPETAYTFRVRAVDMCGNLGEWSEELTVSTLKDTYPPVITGITPGPGYYNGNISLRFTADDDYGISAFVVQTSPDGVTWTELTTVDTTQKFLSYVLDTTEYEEGSLFVRAIAVDRYGNRSNEGNDAPCNQYIVDRTAPAVPAGVDITSGDGYLAVTWEKGDEADLNTYTVWRSETGEEGSFTVLCQGLQQLYWRDSAVEYGETYHYYVTVRDMAGNESAPSEAVSGVPQDDSQDPQVISISPSEGYVLSASTAIRVRLYDNNKVTQLCWQVDGGEPQTVEVAVTDGVAAIPLDLKAMGSTTFTLTVWCVDAVGRRSASVTRNYTVDLTPPDSTEMTAEAAPLAINITWLGVEDADLAGYQVYRSVNGGSWAYLLQRSAGQSSYTYVDTDVVVGSSYSYYVLTIDTQGNTARSGITPAVKPIDEDVIAPSAILDGATSGTVGMEMSFSAKRSYDNKAVASYLWDFGDESETSTLMEPTHIYHEAGTYTVTLTVTDTSDNKTVVHYQVKVKEPTAVGRLTVTVENENGHPVAGAGVYLDLGSEEQSIVYTDAYGHVTISLPAGSHVIGVYADGHLPAKETVNIVAGVDSSLRLVAVQQDLVVGELTVTRMTLEEIKAAGIDVNDPANQQVFQFTIKLTYGTYEAFIEAVYNGEGTVIRDPDPIKIIDSNDEEREVVVKIIPVGPSEEEEGGSGGWGPDPGEIPMVVVMDIPGKASWLKDFFEVRLTVINQAQSEFVLDGCSATLNMVDGLTLMDTAVTSASPVRDMGSIPGQSSASATWIIRGDKGGDYNLSADFTGVLREFNRVINARFETEKPFHVREGDGLTLDVVVENAILADTDGAIRVGLRNDDADPYYMPNIALDENLVALLDNFKTVGYLNVKTDMEVLNPGETIWWDYLVPRKNWDTLMKRDGEDFFLMDAIVEANGGVELPYTIEEVMPFTISPDLITVSRLHSNGTESDISYVNIGKDTLVGGKVPTLRIRTYKLNSVTGEYEPVSMKLTIKDEYKMSKEMDGADKEDGITVTTNSSGVYDLTGYNIVSVNNDKTYTIRISASRAQPVEIPVVLRGKTAEVGRLNVYAYTQNDKGEITALEGATVTVTGHDVSDKTNEDGLAAFKNIDRGYQEITIKMDGYLPITDLIEVGEESEYSYRLTADDDPSASRILTVTNDMTKWTEGNQTVFPEGRVKGKVQFRLTHRLAENETFKQYLYRIVRDGAVVESGSFAQGSTFMLDLATLKAGDKLQFAMETLLPSDFLVVSPYVDSNIVVTEVPSFLGDVAYTVSELGMGGSLDLTSMFEFDPVKFIAALSVSNLAGGVTTKNDTDGKQQTIIDEVNKYSITRAEKKQEFPIQASYDLSGKFTLSVIVGSSTDYEQSSGIHVRRGVRTSGYNSTTFKGFTAVKETGSKEFGVSGQFRIDFVNQYDPARDQWDLTVIGVIDASQSFVLAKFSVFKIGMVSLGLTLKESAELELYQEGVGPKNQTEILNNGAVFTKVSVGGEMKGAVGVKAFSEKLASGDVYLKVGLDFKLVPDWILSASAALGVEGNVLIWKANKDILSDTWEFAGDAAPVSLMSLYAMDKEGLVLADGTEVTALGTGETLMSDVFDDAAPRLTLLPDGTILMVWCGYTGNDSAPVALYWATCDENGWSAPAMVEQDGTADLYPALVSDGEKVHLVWVDFTESVSADMSTMTVEEIQDYAFTRLGVSYATFDGSGWTSTSLYDGGKITVDPQVAVSPDGRVMVAWISNDANLQAATDADPDCVRWMLLEGGEVTDQGVVSAPVTGIADLALGFGSGFRMGLLANTAEGQLRVHHSRYSAAGWVQPGLVGSLNGEDTAMTMSPDGKIYFLNSGHIYCYESGHLIHLLRHELIAEDASLLTWAETDNGAALLWAASVEGENVLCMVSVAEDGTAGTPTVVMSSDSGTLTTPAAVMNGSRLMVMATHCRGTDEGWQQDLVCLDRTLGVELALPQTGVSHSGYLIPGVAMETLVEVESLGLTAPESFTASIVTENGTRIASAQGGSSLTATIQWKVPADYSGQPLYVTVTAAGDSDSSNNTVVMTNVIRDLALSAPTHVGRMDGVEIFTIRVTNLGLAVSPATTLSVTPVQGIELVRSTMPVVNVPELEPGASVDIRVELTLDRTVNQPLSFRLDEADGDSSNDAAYFTLHAESLEEKKETVVSFDGWQQAAGKASASWTVDNRKGETGTFTVMVASYDQFGKMLDCAVTTVQVEGGVMQTVAAEVAEGHTVRAYLMDDSWSPLDSAKPLGE